MRPITPAIAAMLALFLLWTPNQSEAQTNPNNPLLYSNQANFFAERGFSFDPVSITMPGTAYGAGIGSFMDNPASVALFDEGFTTIGLSHRIVNEEGTYLGNTRSFDANQTNLANIGFAYAMPTQQGSLVFGAAYTQNNSFNRAFSFSGRNENNTITDKFKAPGSSYADIAFSTFATDFGDEFEDWDESIFRIGFDQFGDFLGIRQQGEITQRGFSGEYSFFLGTEFQENLMVGFSAGVMTGRFSYDRLFQEVDEFNDYNDLFIDSNDDGTPDTDIDNILLEDQIRSSFTGFRGRAGAIYRLNNNLTIGASYTLGSRITVDEDFDARIRTTFNNGVNFTDDLNSEFRYRVSLPSQISLGVGLHDIGGLSGSFSADYIDYSATRIDFRDGELFEDEMVENDFIAENFTDVWNLRAGLAYAVNPDFEIRGGYSFLPSRFIDGTDDRTIISGGVSFALSRDIRLELAGQYAYWDETSSVYDYAAYDYSPLPDSPPNFEFRSQEATRTVDRWNVLATLRFKMY
ncbi:MAG: outer membrane protein transport protein [Balneolaceae bacterium]|nr:outer membrane protein transport protein [Balneolaceae bacterium]MCH8548443.1 outer membrane protein transport protein [Balneolaceae bacterium]